MITKIGNAIMILAFASMAHAGNGPGNADTDEAKIKALKQLMENDAFHLKASMVNFLETLNFDTMNESTKSEVAAKNFFKRVGKEKLSKDILKSEYTLLQGCHEDNRPEVTARTYVGKLESQVCFDIAGFYKTQKTISHNERVFQLISLAFHEHVHHFQNPGLSDSILEDEAYAVSSYIINNIEFGQVAVARWKVPAGPLYRTYFTGDRAKGIQRQLAANFDDPNRSLRSAKNIRCQTATIVYLMRTAESASAEIPKYINYPVEFVACSSSPDIPPSALEAAVTSEGFRNQIVMGVQDKRSFDAELVSCYSYSDRCMIASREYRASGSELVTPNNPVARF